DPFPVALELRTEIVGVFLVLTAQAFPAFGGVGSEKRALLLFKILPGTDRHKIVMDDRVGESRDGKLSDEQGVKKAWNEENKSRGDPSDHAGLRLLLRFSFREQQS
ncbi:MAG: hypothetical protein EBS97_09205, partial [Verrucomicrobia bacterium]|nr:hypothetical protein [Verrucomicrobiota bacterium]